MVAENKKTINDKVAEPEKYMILAVALIALFLLGFYAYKFRDLSTDTAHWGQLGDYIGGLLNPLVSACTLYVAISVWRLQKNELAVTQKLVKEQATTSEQQRQEQRFFDLLGLYQRTVDSITFVDRVSHSVNSPVVLSVGKQAFSNLLDQGFPVEIANFLKFGISDKVFSKSDDTKYIMSKELLVKTWNSSNATSQFDHYFRVVFRLLTESENLLKDQHFRYVKLLRAQLNRSELIMLGLNILLDEEGKKMVPLIEKYGLLKHLPNGPLRTQLSDSMPHSIFGCKKVASSLSNSI